MADRYAQHLTVFDIRSAKFTPGRHMVDIHFTQFPDFALVGTVPNGTERTVGFT